MRHLALLAVLLDAGDRRSQQPDQNKDESTIGVRMNPTDIQEAVRGAIARGLAIVGLAGIALIHLLDAPGQFDDTPYLGWMYIGLIAGCIMLGVALLYTNDARVWAATAVLSVSVMVGYALSRTTGLPSATGDIGNWSEPLGMASLFVEASVAAVSAFALRQVVSQQSFHPTRAEQVWQ